MAWKDSPAAVLVYDSTGVVTDANPALYEMLATTPRELLGTSAEDSDWLVTDAADGPIAVHPATAVIKSRRPVRGVLARARRSDGVDVWIQVDAMPELSDEGDIRGVVATVADVTHLVTGGRAGAPGSGDHIVAAVTDVLAQAKLDPQA